ncbi:hypothetical protein GGP77_002316 [Salinibacter ruber]|uniref:sulfotransferase family protein n=1 Tax=Salinibacter ruber TaxID=146919 RepID=UPI0021672B09|nr:sulfotransferase family protein [Salinibacter ruber]MCS3668073.1 hypothetical protein [Salinibacter ruber]
MRSLLKKGATYTSQALKKISHHLDEYVNVSKFFFMHIPKTGGTSVKSAFRKNREISTEGWVDAKETRRMMEGAAGENLCNSEYLREVFKLRQAIAVRKMRKGKSFVVGHIPVTKNMIESFPEYRFFTIIRDPVERWVSEYRFGYEIGSLESFIGHEPPKHPIDGVEMALNSEEGGRYSRNMYTCYFSGFGWQSEFRSSKARMLAKSNVKKFDAIFKIKNMKHIEQYVQKNNVKIEIGEKKNITSYTDNKSKELNKYMKKESVKNKIYEKLMKMSTFMSMRGEILIHRSASVDVGSE